MPKLLTIAVPTYNRAAALDQQLAWINRNIAEMEAECAVVISDNASTDDTPNVCAKWRDALTARGVEVRVNRNEQNIGPLPNIARCIDLATSRFTWVIGDDDEIPDDKIAWVVARLAAEPDLASIVLNFKSTGKSQFSRCFSHPMDLIGEGEYVMGECLRQAYCGLAFMTAQIYRTEFVQAAVRAWPEGRSNYDFQVFLTAFVGLRGKVLATRETHCTYVTGDNVYERNKRVAMKLYADALDVFINLARIGYDLSLCREIAWRHVWQYKKRFVVNAFRVNPALTLQTIGRSLRYLALLEISQLAIRPLMHQRTRGEPAQQREVPVFNTLSPRPMAQ